MGNGTVTGSGIEMTPITIIIDMKAGVELLSRFHRAKREQAIYHIFTPGKEGKIQT
jgi:hypothetical protein